MRRDRVVIIPYGRTGNENEVNKLRILEENYDVYGCLAEPLDLREMIRTKAVFLGWTEQILDARLKTILLLYKLTGTRIFWYYHNKLPHEYESSGKAKKNIRWLADHSTKILLHSKASVEYLPNKRKNEKKAKYVPMVEYSNLADENAVKNVRKHYNIDENSFLFTIFGHIRPYKNLESAIEAFIELNLDNAKLLIVGQASDNAYYKRIKDITSSNRNIIIDNRFVPDRILDYIVTSTDVVIAYYHDETALNSGVMIHAFSCGKPVISADICTARDYSQYDFVYCCKGELKNELKRAYDIGKAKNAIIGQKAMKLMKKDNNYNHVANIMYNLIEGKNV